jgi:sulfur-oxidizing protein SoxB
VEDLSLGPERGRSGDKTYKVAGWAPVAEGAQSAPVWDMVARVSARQEDRPGVKLNQPRVVGLPKGNPGIVL